ncbi:MAG TPA: thiol reductant ABC exporter subunit CydC [Gaiellaceae bacterium]|nr:thiol reductant ABC exporter subunit CydC [Gaiellaceae bacterium]
MIVVLRRLLALSGIRVSRVGISVALGTLTIAFGVGLMATAGYLIARAAERPAVLSLTIAIVAVRFFGLARPIARYVDRLWSHDLALRALGRIRARFYERIESLSPAGLQAFRRGDLMSRMLGDVDALQGLYLRGVGPTLVAVVAGAVCVGAAAAFLPGAGFVLAVGLLLGGIAVPFLTASLGRASGRRQAAARGELTAEIVDVLRAAPELVVYGADERALERIRSADRSLDRLARRDALAGGVGDGLSILAAGLTVTGVLAVAVNAHHHGTLDRVLVAMLALLTVASFEAVTGLPSTARELAATLNSGRRVLELIDREPTVRDPAEALDPPTTPSPALEGVAARYDASEEPVLVGLDLSLERERRVALVGPSGSGKTTVTNLLLRFLDPEEGRVTLAGRDLHEYRQDDVRATFALAGQEAHLFDSTIRANLLLAKPDATEADLDLVLRRSHLDDWVASLPEGLDTRVGEDGNRLSGGQRQRLTIARALLSDAPVLILDEPTAHLDPATAQVVVRDAFAAAGARSVLLVTHRPEGLDLVDEIVRL